MVEILAVDDVEAEKLLLGLREGAVEHQGLGRLADGGRGGGGQQPGDRPHPPFGPKLLLHGPEAGHDGRVLLLRPGVDDVFPVVAEDGVEHGQTSGVSVSRTGGRPALRHRSRDKVEGAVEPSVLPTQPRRATAWKKVPLTVPTRCPPPSCSVPSASVTVASASGPAGPEVTEA